MEAYSKVSGALADPLMIRDHHCASPDLLRAVSGPHRRRYGINMLVSDLKRCPLIDWTDSTGSRAEIYMPKRPPFESPRTHHMLPRCQRSGGSNSLDLSFDYLDVRRARETRKAARAHWVPRLIFVGKYFFQAMCVLTTLLMHATSKFYTYIKYMHHLRPSG